MPRLHTHGQHFLRSPRLVAELVGHSNIRRNDTVYDLGAGSGVITSVLARRCRSVVAVEIEPGALTKLRQNAAHLDNVTILAKDILNVEPPNEPYKIFANIPFHLSAQVVRKFTDASQPPTSMYLITQKQFARKLVPGDDHFTSQLSAQISPFFTARIRRPLRKTDFTPPPAVDTVLLEIKPRSEPLLAADKRANYQAFVGRCFEDQKFFALAPRQVAKLSPELRPSQLTPEQWVALYHAAIA
jgi:23S rRNA (adenine-N6)-dimethyltransferase